MWSLQPLDTHEDPIDMLTASAAFLARHDRTHVDAARVQAPSVPEAAGLFLRASFGNRKLAAAVARILACRPSVLLDAARALEG